MLHFLTKKFRGMENDGDPPNLFFIKVYIKNSVPIDQKWSRDNGNGPNPLISKSCFSDFSSVFSKFFLKSLRILTTGGHVKITENRNSKNVTLFDKKVGEDRK